MPDQQKSFVHIFFSYAHQDKSLRDKLEEHLSILKYRGLITTWHDKEISAGNEWANQIDIHLNSADIILLLISSSFMASQYCYSIEMQRALERQIYNEATVIPILLRPTLFTGAPFARLAFLPKNGKPVVKWRNRDSAFVSIAQEIERLSLKIKRTRNLPLPPYLGIYTPTANTTALPYPLPPTIPAIPATIPAIQGPPNLPPYLGRPSSQNVNVSSQRVSILRIVVGLCFILGFLLGLGILITGILLPQYPLIISFVIAMAASLVLLSLIRTRFTFRYFFRYFSPLSILLGGLLLGIPSISIFMIRHPNTIPVVVAMTALAGVIVAIRAVVKKRQEERMRRAEEERMRRAEEERMRRAEEELLMQEGSFIQQAKEQEYYDKALDAYQRAVLLNPTDTTALRGRGSALYALGNYRDALNDLKRAVLIDPTAISYSYMGSSYFKLKNYEESLLAYQRATELDPTSALAWYGMGDTLEQIGNMREAALAYEKAKQLDY